MHIIEVDMPDLINVIHQSGTPARNGGGAMTTTQMEEEVDRTLRCTTCLNHENSILISNVSNRMIGIKNKDSIINLLELPDNNMQTADSRGSSAPIMV
jgi:hypothetical protein